MPISKRVGRKFVPGYFANEFGEIGKGITTADMLLQVRNRLCVHPDQRQQASVRSLLKVRFAVLIADISNFIETSELQCSVLVDGRPYVFAIVTRFNLLYINNVPTLNNSNIPQVCQCQYAISKRKSNCFKG